MSNSGTPGVSTVVFSYTYDAVGNRTLRTETINGSAGATVTHTYDNLNRATKIEQAGTSIAEKRVDLAYNAIGQYTSIKRYKELSGTTLVVDSTYTYDDADRLKNLKHLQSSTTFASYTYDSANRITQMTSSADSNGTTTFTYDNGKRLETSLPDVATGSIVFVVPPHVRRQQPLHPAAQIARAVRPEAEVEVIGH